MRRVDIDPTVTLRIPALGAPIVLVRVAVAAMCARLDFPIDRIDDVRLAVDEAASLLLADAQPEADLSVRYTPLPDGGLDIELSCPTVHGRNVPTDGFSWTVLTALVDEVTATVDPARTLSIRLQAHPEPTDRP